MRDDIASFLDMASRLAQEEKLEIDATASRTVRLLDNLAVDLDSGTREQASATLRLLEDSLARLEELAVEADTRAGRRPSAEVAAVPEDWGGPEHSEGRGYGSYALLDARSLGKEIAARRGELAKESLSRLTDDHRRVAGDIGEMARALVGRQGEVAPLSRRGFVNCALRIEVLSDNLVSRQMESDRPAFRRQLIMLRDALDDLDGFLSVEASIAEGEP